MYRLTVSVQVGFVSKSSQTVTTTELAVSEVRPQMSQQLYSKQLSTTHNSTDIQHMVETFCYQRYLKFITSLQRPFTSP